MKYLRPGSLALGENNAKLNIWHGRTSDSLSDVLTQGYFKTYFKMLAPGDIVVMALEGKEVDIVEVVVASNSSKPEDLIAKDDFIKVKLLKTSVTIPAKEEDTPEEFKSDEFIKNLKQQIKAELARTYELTKK